MATSTPAPTGTIQESVRLFFEHFSQAAELVSKLGALAIAASYLTGLLIVNIYLWGIGISQFSLLKVRFIYTGAVALLWLFLSIFLIGLAAFIQTLPNEDLPHPFSLVRRIQMLIDRPRWLPSVLIWLTCIGYPLYYANRILTGHYWPVRLMIMRAVLPAYIKILLIALALLLLWVLSSGSVDKYFFVRTTADRHMFLAIFMLIMVVSFAGYLREFAHKVYPMLPEQAGGGMPKEVQLLIPADRIPLLAGLGISICKSGLTEKVMLIFDGDDSLVLQLNKGQLVELRKEMIQGIRSTPLDCGP